MKKYLILAMVIVSLLVTGLVVYADSKDVEVPEWFSDMMEWRRGEIDKAVEDGSLTEEQAEAWLDHIDEMEAFHLEEGLSDYRNGSCPGGGFGGSGFGGGCRRGRFSEGFNIRR